MTTKGTALITGASTGIGAVYAHRLAERGYDLILVARNLAKLDALAEKLRAATGRAVATIKADLGQTAELRAVEQRLKDDASITMLVNNAGLGATAKLTESDPAAMDDMINLNVTALTRLTMAAVPGMAARKNGTIVNIASIVAVSPETLNGVYGGSKAYVLALTQSMQHELADKGIRVQAVLPGAIDTPFWDAAGLPVQHLPSAIVMTPENLVDAALAGLDMGEVVTLPALEDASQWQAMESARLAMAPNLSRTAPASRYKVAA